MIMSYKLRFSNLPDAFEAIKAILRSENYDISEKVDIQYGLQFKITKNNFVSLVRIFFSKKKGCTLDLSQVKNENVKNDILGILKLTNSSQNKNISENKSKLYCLSIGINEYSNNNFAKLSFADKDAEELYEKVSTKYGHGTGTLCLLNKKATKENIINYLEEIKIIVKEEDSLIFLFTGHGEFYKVGNKTNYYLITYDTKYNDLDNTALNMSFIKTLITKIKCKKKIIFLDSCYSGGISKNPNSTVVTDSTKDYVFNNLISEDYSIITSSQPSQMSWECNKLNHGVFSYFLIKGLCGAVESKNGEVDLMTLYLFIHHAVSNYVKTKFLKKQEPKFFGAFTGFFHLPLLVELEELKKEQQIKFKEKEFTFEKVKCIGIDESGKGDYFGPLTVAAVYVKDEQSIQELKKIGVKDSKKLPDTRIKILAKRIKQICDNEVIGITPPTYNRLYSNMGNLNEILAWGHAQSLEKVLIRNKDCKVAISDKFGGSQVLLSKLKEKGNSIELIQRPKAEENLAVAAASVLARAKFVEIMESMTKLFKHPFSKGANEIVKREAVDFLAKQGDLKQVAKVHFKTHKEVLTLRSEERRVGKECRSRWSPYH